MRGPAASVCRVVRSRFTKLGIATVCLVVAGGIGVNAFFGPTHCHFPEDFEHNVQTGARVLRTSVQSWQAGSSSTACPDLAQLKSERYLDPGWSGIDPWGTEYRITCTSDEVTISCAGPDRHWETRDDTRVPSR
jgi:hypothetical protein